MSLGARPLLRAPLGRPSSLALRASPRITAGQPPEPRPAASFACMRDSHSQCQVSNHAPHGRRTGEPTHTRTGGEPVRTCRAPAPMPSTSWVVLQRGKKFSYRFTQSYVASRRVPHRRYGALLAAPGLIDHPSRSPQMARVLGLFIVPNVHLSLFPCG